MSGVGSLASQQSTYLRFVIFAIVLPLLFVTLPPIFYPHIFCFVLPPGLLILICAAFLCFSAAVKNRVGSGEPVPSLAHHEQPATPPSADTDRTGCDLCPAFLINVVMLPALEAEISSHGPAATMSKLFNESSLLQRVRVDECSFAIISYRQVKCRSDDFTLDIPAFTSAVGKAHEAGVDALWLDGWCYRQDGEYNHAAFCAELAQVMRHVSAVIWLPRSRNHAPPSYQFRLWVRRPASDEPLSGDLH